MTSIGSPSPFFLAGKKAYEVKRSLRFNAADSAYLRRDTAAGNRRKLTISLWVKRAKLTSQQILVNTGDDGGNQAGLQFLSGDTINFYTGPATGSGNPYYQLVTTAVFRDPGAWYHIVAVYDTENSTQADRTRLYVNGERLTSFGTEQQPPQDFDTFWNQNGKGIALGIYEPNNSSLPLGGYMAEVNFIDGSALDQSYFGETDALTGQWNPKKYTGSYGTNGFYLNFLTNTLGTDRSGNGNDFTPNNFSVAAGVGNDSLEDTPTNNFCTLNLLSNGTGAIPNNGNLDFATTGGATGTMTTTIPLRSGKWYCETTITFGSNNSAIGIRHVDETRASQTLGSNGDDYAYRGNGRKFNNNSKTSYGDSYTTNDVIGIKLDLDNGTIEFFKNNTSQGVAFSGITGTYVFAIGDDNVSSAFHGSFNFGQRAFSYTPPTGFKAVNTKNLPDPVILRPNKHFGTINYSGINNANRAVTDANNVDFTPDFAWFKQRTSNNWHGLVNSVIGSTQVIWTNSTDAEGSYTDGVKSFTENGMVVGNTGAINTSGHDYFAHFWNAGDTDSKTYKVVVVSDSGNKYRFRNSADDATFPQSAVTLDLAEGGTYIFDQSDSSNAGHPLRFSTTSNGTHGGGTEYTTGVTVVGTPGSSGAYTQIVVAASAPTLYYYCTQHSGMGGQVNTNSTTGSSNFDGSIQTRVKANPTAGFSIVSYSGNGTAGATIGHGLGVIPEVRIVVRRNYQGKRIFALDFGPSKDGHYLELNTNVSEQTNNNAFNSANPTSSTVVLGSSNATNNAGGTHIAYIFANVPNYSKGGFYIGNGSNDGTFVYTGFKPAFLLIKATQNLNWWQLQEINSLEGNTTSIATFPNQSNAEDNQTAYSKDILSNGFKLRGTSGGANYSGQYFYYLAFAESPFKNSRAV